MTEIPMQLWRVKPSNDSNVVVIVWSHSRSQALRMASDEWLDGYGSSDNWIADPITMPGDRVRLGITLNV